MTLKRFVLVTLAVLTLTGLTACGYHVGDSRTPNETLRIFLPVVENVSARPVDLNEITSDFRESLESIKGVIIVNQRDEADIVLLGRITMYKRTWGPTAFKGDTTSAAGGGLKENAISASTARIILAMEIEKRTSTGEKQWASIFNESDVYEMSDRLELMRGSAATPQIHASREALLVRKLASRIFQRARAQIVDNF